MDVLLQDLCDQVNLAETIHRALIPIAQVGDVMSMELGAALFARLAWNARHMLMCLVATGAPEAAIAMQVFHRAVAGEADATARLRTLVPVAMAA